MGCLGELHCQQVRNWALVHVFLIFKGVIDLPQARIKMGRTKCCQTRRDWKRALSGAAKGFIWSIYCHGNSECDLEASLALSQVERFGGKKKSRDSAGEGAGWERSCPGTATRGCGSPSAYCAKAHSEVPASSGERGPPVLLLQVARPAEDAGNLFKVFLTVGGLPQHAIRSFIPSFLPSFCKQSLRAYCVWDTAKIVMAISPCSSGRRPSRKKPLCREARPELLSMGE